MPLQRKIASVVGSWIWIQFKSEPPAETRRDLSQLGFHWNNKRKLWQHPCGSIMQQDATLPRIVSPLSGLGKFVWTFFPGLCSAPARAFTFWLSAHSEINAFCHFCPQFASIGVHSWLRTSFVFCALCAFCGQVAFISFVCFGRLAFLGKVRASSRRLLPFRRDANRRSDRKPPLTVSRRRP